MLIIKRMTVLYFQIGFVMHFSPVMIKLQQLSQYENVIKSHANEVP